MNPASARSLLIAGVPTLVVAGMIGAPEGRGLVALAGGLCAFPALLCGTQRMKAGAVALMLAAAALAWGAFGSLNETADAHRARRGHRSLQVGASPAASR